MFETIQKELVAAMKAHDKVRLSVIKMAKAAIDKERIDKKCDVTDELVIDVLSKQLKMRQDSKIEFEKAGRIDLVEDVEKEIEILKQYLPEPLTEKEVEQIINIAIEEVVPEGIKDMGKVMALVSPKVKGRYDLKNVSAMIKNKLN